MGKTSKWLRSFLTGKKDHREKDRSETGIVPAPITPATPKEKRRWSFRRSSATAPAANAAPRDSAVNMTPPSPVVVAVLEREEEPKKHSLTVAAATAAAANAAAAAAQAAAAAVRMTAVVEEAAAVKIQAFFRSYLARKALRALKGLVKLQALVRGHLVRKRATATLRCMQALVTLQAKARAQRLGMVDDTSKPSNPRLSTHRKSTQDSRIKNIHYENEENIKIVEMDIGEMNRNQHHHHQQFKMYSGNTNRGHEQLLDQYSPAPSALTEMSPRAYSHHFEDYTNSFNTAQSSPQCFKYREFYCSNNNNNSNNADSLSLYDYPLFPNYMANTQSSRAKARSQSAPKQRPPELYERQTSGRRRDSVEVPRNSVQRAMRMQRSSSQMSATATVAAKEYYQQYYPWMAIKLDRSNVSLKDSECGSTSTVMTNTNYCRSLVTCGAHGNRY